MLFDYQNTFLTPFKKKYLKRINAHCMYLTCFQNFLFLLCFSYPSNFNIEEKK